MVRTLPLTGLLLRHIYLPTVPYGIVNRERTVLTEIFSKADYNLPLRGFAQIRNISVSENGVDYRRVEGGDEEGTFWIGESRSQLEINWNYRASNEVRTFTLTYELDGALVVGPDYAEFTWIYLSDRWDRSTRELSVELTFSSDYSGSFFALGS